MQKLSMHKYIQHTRNKYLGFRQLAIVLTYKKINI